MIAALSLALSDQHGRFDAIGIAHGRAIVTAETAHGTASAEIDVRETNSGSVELVLQPRAAPLPETAQ